MKKDLFLKVAALVVLISTAVFIAPSCEKVKELAEFDIAYPLPDVHFTIDSVDYLPKAERLLYQQTMTLNVDSIIQKHDLDGIGKTQFEYVRLEVETPAWVNFSWLNSARATVSATGLSETEVAVVTTINPDGRSVELQLTNTNVSATISTGSFVLRLYGDVRPPLPAAVIRLVIKSKLKMTVKPV